MDRRSRSRLTRVGIGLAGLTAVVAIPFGTSKPEEVHSRPVSHVQPAPQQQQATVDTPPDTGCITVDANGVPLFDSQYEQRTGHAPC